ncbi:MAG TPA: hypothetical protein VNK04_08400 [Gemmataceae bacterium]|nr:hypothetical protein [Gemmataceae bacterium]
MTPSGQAYRLDLEHGLSQGKVHRADVDEEGHDGCDQQDWRAERGQPQG